MTTAALSEPSISASAPGVQNARAWIKAGPKRLLIDGGWFDAVSGRTFDTIDPATEEKLTIVAEADAADIDIAVRAARRAFDAPTWGGISPHTRTRLLLKIADAVEKNAEELAVIETLDNGTPLSQSVGRVAGVVEVFRYFAGWPTKILGTTNPTDGSRFIYMLREPMGVCGLINAWNVPVMMAAMKIAPAIACGNTCVLKPAEQAPLSTLRLGELIQECDMPPGVVNILPGYGATAGAAIAAHGDVDKIAFTGSTGVGRQIMQLATGNLKKVTLELGGKSPNIIFSDADIDAAAQSAVNGFCKNNGQICSSGTRLFVQKSIEDEVIEKVSKIVSTQKVGAPLSADTDIGPLISDRQMGRVLSYIDKGSSEGAKLVLGGTRVGVRGYFVEPTIFADVANEMTIAREEIFGPVLSVITFKDENDAIFQGNDTHYGLASAVWTRDVQRAHKVARALKAGRVWINTYAEGDPVMSIGGYKQSGFGRENGAESIEAYTQTKSVYMKL